MTRIAPPLVRLALVAAAAVSFALPVAAQAPPVPRKLAGGPWIIPGTPTNRVEAGRDIQWSVTALNPSPTPGVFTFIDAPQGNHLPPASGGQRECETGGQGAASEAAAAQQWLFFPDADGDGQCEAAAQVTDAGGAPIPATIACDAATQTLTIGNMNIGGFQSATITFVTKVDINAAPGSIICNWGHIYAPAPPSPPAQRTDTYPEAGNTAGCTCLTVAPASGFNVEVTKVGTITAASGRLVPGDPDSTIQYAITVVNTGSSDIADGQFVDSVGGPTVAEGRGLEWVSVDDAGGLTCALNPTNTRLNCTGMNLPSTDPDSSVTVLATARVTCAAATDTDNGQVCNQADFSVAGQPGSFPTDDPSTALLGDATCTPVVWSDLTVSQKFVDDYDDRNGNNQLDVGERVNFRIRAKNAGTLTATAVTVTDDVGATTCLDTTSITALDGGTVAGGVITWDVGDLAPLGGFRDVRFSAVLTADALCCNQASVQSAERQGCAQPPILTDDDAVSEDPARNPPSAVCASPGPQPDLNIAKSVELIDDTNGNGQYDLGERIRWTVTVENVGLGTATNAAFNDGLSICMRNFIGATGVTLTTTDGTDAGDASCSVQFTPPVSPGTVCVQTLGGANGIVPGETVTIAWENTIQGTVSGCCNQGEVTYDERATPVLTDDAGTPGLVDDPSCLIQPPCVPTGRLEKAVNLLLDTDLDGRLEVGEGIEYVMTFTNVGCGDLTNIRIQDASQACLTLDPVNITVVPAAGVTNNSTGGNLDIVIAGPVAPTESVTITMRGTGAAVEPNCCNQATWTAPDGGGGTITGLSDYDVTDLSPEQPTCNRWVEQDGGGGGGNPDLGIAKSILGNPTCIDPGGLVKYEIVVGNVGDGSASTFTVTDQVPAGLTNVVVTAPLTYDAGTGTVSVTDGPLVARDSRTYSFQANAPCSAGGGTVSNTARVAYTDSTGTPIERTGQVDVQYGLPNLSTSTKSRTVNAGANGVLEPGETVDFTITVRNTGTCDAKVVTVTDAFDAAFDVAAATIGQGGTRTGNTVTWDNVTTPALVAIAPGGSVDLTVTVPVAAGATTETRVTNGATITATGHDLTTCGLPQPGASPTAAEVCINCAVVTGQQDLLRAAVSGPALRDVLVGDQIATQVVENAAPNANTCGETGLDTATDVVQADVGATLATGVTLPAAQVQGILVFLEASERCQADEGGSDTPICVRKDRATGDLTVITCP